MRFLSSRAHGVLDYLTGILLILAPRILGFQDAGIAAQVPVFLGIATIVYSLLTRYELGLIRVLPFGFHLTLDFFAGVFLAASPWLLGFADRVWAPHLIVGLFEVVASLSTRRDVALREGPTRRGRGAAAH